MACCYLKSISFWLSLFPKSQIKVDLGSGDAQNKLDIRSGETQNELDLGSGETKNELDFK